jgi:hypothetical protein
MNKDIHISILVPTKNRVFNIKKLVYYALGNATRPENIEIIFYVDYDDYESQNYISSYKNDKIFWTTTKEKVLFSDMWNYCYNASSGRYLMLCGDDVTFETNGWDIIVKNIFDKYEDKLVYVVPYDGNANGVLGVHGFLSREWVDIVGFFTPPYFSYWYADTWIDEISKKIGRFHYTPEIKVIHNHWESPNRTFVDDLYIQNKKKLNDQLHQLWKDKQQERNQQANLLLSRINK